MNAYVQGQHHPARSVSRPRCDGGHRAPARHPSLRRASSAPAPAAAVVARRPDSRPHGSYVATRLAPEGAERAAPRRRPRAPDESADPLLLYARQVRAARVELLVALHEVRPVGAQPVHEDAAHLAAQVQRRCRRCRSRRPRRAARRISSTCSGSSLMPGISGATRTPVGMPARLSSATASSRARGLGVCGSLARQAFSSSVGTERFALTSVTAAISCSRSRSRSSSGDFVSTEHGLARVAQRLPDPGHQLVAPLDPLVRVGVGAQRDVLALPRRPRQLGAQHLRHVDLDDDLALEVAAGVEVEVGVGGASEAVCARMGAAPDRRLIVQRNGIRDALGTRLSADFARTS